MKINKNTFHQTSLGYIAPKKREEMVIYVTFEQNEIFLLKQRDEAEEWLLQILKDKCQALRLHNWKNISSLNLRLEKCGTLTSNLLFSLIKRFSQRLPHLRKLILDFDGCEGIGNKEIEVIGFAISKHMICLESLHFRFVNDHSITEKGLEALGHHFKKFQFNLTDLTILFNSSYDNTYGNGIKDFIASVRKSHSTLKHLTLGLDGCCHTNDQDVENFMPEVGKLRLEKLGLILSYCSNLTDETFESIKAQFPKLLNLQKLTLALRGCKELTENGSQQFLSAINSSLINLKQLNLDFRHGKGWTDNNLVVFANTMQEKSSNMQSLTVQGLGNRQDYSKGLEALGSRFRNSLANLLSLTIESMWAKFTTQSFVEFAKNIALLSRLKKLGLSFEYCPAFNDTCAKNLIVAITENLTNLEELSLIFSSCEQITDQGMEQIGHHLGQNVNKLKSLKLDFSSTKLMTDAGLEVFASKIGTGLHDLKSFALNFSFCDQITGKGLAALCLGLEGHLQDLEEFIFDLMSLPLKDDDFNTWAPFLGKDKAVEFLALGISQNLSHLHALVFNIEECTKITDIALDAFCSNIKERCRNLFKLQLNMERRNEITIKAIDKWTEELKCIPNLIIF